LLVSIDEVMGDHENIATESGHLGHVKYLMIRVHVDPCTSPNLSPRTSVWLSENFTKQGADRPAFTPNRALIASFGFSQGIRVANQLFDSLSTESKSVQYKRACTLPVDRKSRTNLATLRKDSLFSP
jgi:hypothetical protein